MTLSRIQFTLQAVVWATFWMAACFGGVVAHRSIPPAWEFRGPELLRTVLQYATFYLGIVSPFIAVGILLGRTTTGVIAGFVATSVLIAGVSLLILLKGGSNSDHETNEWIATIALHTLIVVAGIWLFARRRSRSSFP